MKRLQVILAHAGVASRRKAALIIEQGMVAVNGKVVREKGARVNEKTDEISVGGKTIFAERKVYFLLNKPRGVVTSAKDERSRKTVLDIIDSVGKRVYPVGRLDMDSEGILILTNDGDLAFKLMHPSFEIEKVYLAKISGKFKKEDVKFLTRGIVIEGKKARAKKVILKKSVEKYSELIITLTEGKKRQIKRMLFCMGYRVIRLKRISYAGIKLNKLGTGDYRFLNESEVKKLYSLVGQ